MKSIAPGGGAQSSNNLDNLQPDVPEIYHINKKYELKKLNYITIAVAFGGLGTDLSVV